MKTFDFGGKTYSSREYKLECQCPGADCATILEAYNWCLTTGVDPSIVPYNGYYRFIRPATPQEIKEYDDRSKRSKEAYAKRKATIKQKEIATLRQLAAKHGKTVK